MEDDVESAGSLEIPVTSVVGVGPADTVCSDHGSGGSEESEDSDDAASREDDLFFDDSYLHEEEPKNPHELHKHGSISEPLMPLTYVDASEATEHFTQVFTERYGPQQPLFFVGGLEEAIENAQSFTPKKPVVIYIHSDTSIATNIFCSNVLCNEVVVQYLAENVIIWPWDITRHEYREILMETISEVLGLDTKDHVLKILCSGADLPVCLVYYHPVATADSFKHSTNGSNDLCTFLSTIMTVVDMCKSWSSTPSFHYTIPATHYEFPRPRASPSATAIDAVDTSGLTAQDWARAGHHGDIVSELECAQALRSSGDDEVGRFPSSQPLADKNNTEQQRQRFCFSVS